MHVYLAIYSALCLKAVAGHRQRQTFFLLFAGVFLIWFMGFRYEIGCDYYGYLVRWNNYVPPTSIIELFERQEIGFELLIWGVKTSGLDYTWLNVAASTILVACYLKFSSEHPFAAVILALIFPVLIVQLGMSGIRQALAGSFLMLAFNAFSRRKMLWTAFWILVGIQFHTSAAVFLPIVLLVGRKIEGWRIFSSIFILGPIASLFLADRLDVYEVRYGAGDVVSFGAIFRYALLCVPVALFALYYKRAKSLFPDTLPLLTLSAFIIISLSPLIALSSIALHRLGFYVFPLSILLFVYAGAAISKKPSQGHWLAMFAYGCYLIVWFLTSKHADLCYTPYNNIWFMDSTELVV